ELRYQHFGRLYRVHCRAGKNSELVPLQLGREAATGSACNSGKHPQHVTEFLLQLLPPLAIKHAIVIAFGFREDASNFSDFLDQAEVRVRTVVCVRRCHRRLLLILRYSHASTPVSSFTNHPSTSSNSKTLTSTTSEIAARASTVKPRSTPGTPGPTSCANSSSSVRKCSNWPRSMT